MKKVLQMIMFFILFCVTFIISFHLPTRNIIEVYTYYGFISLAILTIILILILYFLVKKSILKFDIKDCIIIVILCFFVNCLFFGMVPVTMERSISVFMINELDKDKQISKTEIEQNFINKYVYENGAFDKRLVEQMAINNIEENNTTYNLSKRGKFMLKCFKLVDKVYGVNSKLLK